MAKFKEKKPEVAEVIVTVPVSQPSTTEVKQKEEPKKPVQPVQQEQIVIVDEVKQV